MSELTKEMPKKLGFGCMRLPVTDGSTENINDAAFCEMVDSYIEQGFKYFDTAYPCLLYTSPSPRDAHESRMPSSA